MKDKRYLTTIFILTFLALSFFPTKVTKAYANKVTTDAESYVVIDAESGAVLKGKNENEILVPASTTKVMTAIVVLENSNINDVVTIGEKPQYAEGTSIGLKKGDKYTVEDLMHGLLLESANDCAEALAEYVGGTRENFIDLMNKKASDLGLTKTHFVNPSGLWEDDNVTTNKTTAYELSLILKEALKYPDYIRISQKLNYKFPPLPDDTFEKWVNNKNELIFRNGRYSYEYAIAGKSGYTRKSKHTFTAAAEKDGRTLIVSILKSSSKDDYFPFIINLFDYGFDNTTTVKLYSKDETISTFQNDKVNIPLVAPNDIYYTVKNKDYNEMDLSNHELLMKKLSPSVICSKTLKADTYSKGDEIMDAEIMINGEKACDVTLLSGADAPKHVYNVNTFANKDNYKKYLYIVALIIILFFIFKYFIKKYLRRKRKDYLFSSLKNNNKRFNL